MPSPCVGNEYYYYSFEILFLQLVKAVVKYAVFWVFFQSEAEGVAVTGALNFDPAPDAQTLYKAMKGLGELTPATCVNSVLLVIEVGKKFLRKLQPDT